MSPLNAWRAHWPLAALLLAALCSTPGFAQTVAAGTSTSAPVITSPATRWVPVRSGKVVAVAAQNADAVFVLDDAGSVWRLPTSALQAGDFGAWSPLPGNFTRLRATQDGTVWAIDRAQTLYRLVGSNWAAVTDKVRDVAATPDGSLILLLADGQVQYTDTQKPRVLPPDTASATQLLSDEHGLPWIVYASGRALRWSVTGWEQVSPKDVALAEVAIGADGTAIAVTQKGLLQRRLPQTGVWQDVAPTGSLPANIAHVTVDSQGLPWVSTDNGALWAQRLVDTRSATPANKPALFTRLLFWRQVGGASTAVGLGPDGTAMSLSKEGQVWLWKSDNQWSSQGGNFQQLAVGSGGMAWGVDGRGSVSALERGIWQSLTGQVRSIAAGPGNTVWAISPADELQWWNNASRQWIRVQALPKNARQLAMGPRSDAWLIDADGTVQMQQGARWQALPGISAASLAVGPEGTVYATDAGDQSIYWLDKRELQWKPATGRASAIAVGPQGAPWIVAPGNLLMASGRFLQEEAARIEAVRVANAPAVPPVLTITAGPLPTQNKPLSFQNLAMGDLVLQDIGIGGNGAVFALGGSGNLYCFSNPSQRFLLASLGQSKRVAVNAAGAPWLLSTSGTVSRLERNAWQLVPEFLGQDIAIGPDGVAWALDRQGDAYKFDHTSSRFVRVPVATSDAPVKAKRIAGANANTYWLVTDANQLMRCEKGDCRVQLIGVQDVAVAPDNTVFALDLLGSPRRYNAASKQFEKQNGNGVTMAVGPQGLPWLLTAEGKVRYAGLFNPLSKTVNTDQCPAQFSQAPVPVDVPNAALRASDVRTTLPPGGSVALQNVLSVNGRPVVLNDVTVTLTSGPPYLQLRDGFLLVASDAPLGAIATATLNLCPKQAVGTCSSGKVEIQIATVPSAMPAPSAAAGNGQATVNFAPAQGTGGSAIRGYIVTVQPGGGTVTGTASPIAISGLQNGTSYTFSIQAVNSIGIGPASPPSNAVTPASVPDAPSISGVTAGNGQVSVAFAPPQVSGGMAITGYVVSANPGGQSVTGAGSPLVVTGLSNGTTYTFTVKALNALGQSPASPPSAPVTPGTVPGAPSISNVLAGNGQVSVSFVAPVSNGGAAITGYVVSANPGGQSTSGTASPLVVSGLNNGAAYTFTVRASNAFGPGPASAPSVAVTPLSPVTVPGAPFGVSAVAGDAQATVSFNAPGSNGGAPITGYSVTANPGGQTVNTTGSPAVVTGLMNGQSYTFTVRASNSAGTGAASAQSNTIVPVSPISPPSSPGPVGPSNSGPNQITVDFGLSADDGGSPILYYTATLSPGGATNTNTTTPIIFTGVPSGTYTVTVTATNAAGTSAPSAVSGSVTIP